MKKTTLKKKLWKIISEYIRRKYANEYGMVRCVTCGTIKHWKNMQAGHYIPQAQGNAARWDENNIHPQCFRCNMNLGGNAPEYANFMYNTYGKEIVDEMRSRPIVKLSDSDYLQLIEHYTLKLKGLSND